MCLAFYLATTDDGPLVVAIFLLLLFVCFVCFIMMCMDFNGFIKKILFILCLPYHIWKYRKKCIHARKELKQNLIQQVYAARMKIQGGNILEGKRDIAILKAYYGEKRISKILREVEKWFSDV